MYIWQYFSVKPKPRGKLHGSMHFLHISRSGTYGRHDTIHIASLEIVFSAFSSPLNSTLDFLIVVKFWRCLCFFNSIILSAEASKHLGVFQRERWDLWPRLWFRAFSTKQAISCFYRLPLFTWSSVKHDTPAKLQYYLRSSFLVAK